ncbi:hypothetical protein DCAR_0728928 [Daucus carota subsp. sativus]|uniref:Reverse transcriptase domain-containing protein n=1 Tax=Daucus carota subsp. sativus TaxID=79200 RepID=A0AAF1BAP0_DAUCS|nr:hypothetical protein DCAR_0728928 [Daucus carota subsp. sativus]
MKSGYWQIQIKESDKYKTAFTVPFGQYEWNVLPFGLKNAPSDFQNIMNEIFNPYTEFIIVYIDDVLVFSKTLDQHIKHLKIFKDLIRKNGLVISAPKMKLFQVQVRFLGHMISQGKIIPIERSIEFASKFPDNILDTKQLQRFLGSLNYVSDYYKDLAKDTAILYSRLKKNPQPWTEEHSLAVRRIKAKVKCLPCLSLANPKYFKIVETDASNIGYGGILKQINPNTSKEELVRFTSGKWNFTQSKYSTIKKEMLSIIKCISKFQDDLLNQKFLLRIDSQLSVFEFDIRYIKGENNSLADYLTREFLQEHENCSLLDKEIIKKYRKKGYNYIHIGLIQVAVKPLTIKDKTVLIQGSTSEANIQVPKTILWKDINLPSQWILENETPQRPINNNIMNLENVRQYLDGTVRISFDNPNRPLILEELVDPSTASRKDSELLSKHKLKEIRTKGIINEGQTSCPFYSTNSQIIEEDEQNLSPTHSDFEPKPTNHQLLVINKEFTVNWKILNEDFNSKNNKEKRRQFRNNHNHKDREKIVNKWKKFMVKEKINITFYIWYEIYYEDRSKVTSSHPPVENIIIPVKNDFVTASPFKISNGNNSEEKKIIEQNNYTNQCLVTIGKQLDKIEEKFEDKTLIQKQEIKLEKPLLNLTNNRYGKGLPNKDQELVKSIKWLIKKLDKPETKTVAVLGRKEDTSDSDESIISNIRNQFKKLSFKNPNPTSLKKKLVL